MKNERKYSLAIFDLDGTLLDTTNGVISAVKFTIEQMGWAQLEDKVLRSFIGPPIIDSFLKCYDIDKEKAKEAVTIFRDEYKEKGLLKAVPYDGIYEVFDFLQKEKIKTAIATYKPEDYARKLLCHFGFDKYTEIMYGSDFEGKLKKVDIIRRVINDSEIDKYSDAVMIGDSYHDALGALEIPVDFIGVTYGFGFKSMTDVLKYTAIGYAKKPTDLFYYFVEEEKSYKL